MESDLHEMSKPLTRGVDDEDRENHLKDVEHADDPMLQYMRKKRSKIEGISEHNISSKAVFQLEDPSQARLRGCRSTRGHRPHPIGSISGLDTGGC